MSEADPASVEIGRGLREEVDWSAHADQSIPAESGGGTVYRHGEFELRSFEALHLELEDIASCFLDPDAIVFVSKHAGDTGKLLTTHMPGNVGDAAYGGSPNTVPRAASGLVRALYHKLLEHAPEDYDVGIECTHHGPSRVGVPTCFLEVGSGPEEWRDPRPARAVADALLACEHTSPVGSRTVLGFGGDHYAPRFERILRDTKWSVGHIASDWALDEINSVETRNEVVEHLIEQGRPTVALVDGTRPDLTEAIEDRGVRVVSETWLREADDIDLDVLDRIEEMLGSVDGGTRVGEARPTGRLARRDVPGDLVDFVNGFAPQRAIETIAANVVGYGTREGGNRWDGSVVTGPNTSPRELVGELVPILEDRFDEVAFEHETLVLREEQFDPDRARTLGVPEGPAFGRLADGESVSVGDTQIDPSVVRRTVEHHIAVGLD